MCRGGKRESFLQIIDNLFASSACRFLARIVRGFQEIPEMKFWAQCKVPSQFMLLAQPSGVLTRMLVALANTSECSSGFKIIKLYLSLTHLSMWVFLVPRKPSPW